MALPKYVIVVVRKEKPEQDLKVLWEDQLDYGALLEIFIENESKDHFQDVTS